MIKAIEDEDGVLRHWASKPAPQEVIDYYHLPKTATFLDVIYCVRADESCHRETNHFLADVDQNYNIEEEKVFIYG
jgi:ubiquinol oxidase